MFTGQLASVFQFRLLSSERRLLNRCSLIKKMLSNKELLITLKEQINFDTDQNVAAIDWQIAATFWSPLGYEALGRMEMLQKHIQVFSSVNSANFATTALIIQQFVYSHLLTCISFSRLATSTEDDDYFVTHCAPIGCAIHTTSCTVGTDRSSPHV